MSRGDGMKNMREKRKPIRESKLQLFKNVLSKEMRSQPLIFQN